MSYARPTASPFARVTFPADRGYLRLSRANAGAFGESLGLPPGRIEDLSLAVDEAVAWLLDADDPRGWIEVTFEGERSRFLVDGRFHGIARAHGRGEELTRSVLQQTVDHFELITERGQRRFRLECCDERRRAEV